MASAKLQQYNSRSKSHGSSHQKKNGASLEAPVNSANLTRQEVQEVSRFDFLVENHSSIFLLKPQTPSAISWLEEHIGQDNGYQPYWPICVVEHRFIADIVAGIQNDGLAVA
jgi:hypothetical protein